MGESIMATSISDFDLFSMVESLISEEQVSKEEVPTEEFEEEAVKLKIKASNNKKKKASRKEKSKKEEAEPDVIDKDEDKEEVETPDESPSTLRLADALEYKKFIDDLNKFRAAHSFDDEEISKELKSFFQKLEDDEKKVFYIILKGLIQVSLMGVDGKTARTPSELKFSIKKTGSVSSEKKRSMKRKIDIQKDLDDDKKVDTSTPIKIGESRQNKNDVYKVIRENK
tara:strand:- start:427 stop:1107 length:681 start_codon:yes stop_codon:yes gene_type:complete